MLKCFFWNLGFAFSFIVIETAILTRITFLPVIPDLLLIMLLFTSFNNGFVLGELSGFFSGLLLDFLSAAPLGLNSLLRTVLGFFTGSLRIKFNSDKIVIPALMGFLATICKALVVWVIALIFGSEIKVYSFLSSSFWIEVAMNTILTPIMFSFLSLFSFLTYSSERK